MRAMRLPPPCSGAVPALTPHFTLAAGPPVPPSLHWLGTFPAASGSLAGRGGQRGVSGDGTGVSVGLGQGCWQRARPRPSGPQPAPPAPQRPPCGCGGNGRAGGCPWHGAAPWLSGTRLLFLSPFAFSSVPNELGQGDLVWFQKSWFWDVPGLCRAGPSLAPLRAATPGREGAELGVLGQEAPWPRSPRKGCRAGRPSVRKVAFNGTR